MTTASIVRHLVMVLLTTLGLLGASQAVAGTATASEVRPTGLTTVLDSNKDGTVILGFVGAEWDGQAVVKDLNTDQILRTLPNGNGEYTYTACIRVESGSTPCRATADMWPTPGPSTW